MNPNAHVRKTPKGEAEIQTRAHKLDHHLRFVLILVDGSSTVEQIVAKGAGMPGVAEHLTQLAAQGYVAFGGESGYTTPVGGTRTVADVKAELIGIARELLGADSAKIVGKLEAAPETKEGLLEVTGQCKKVIKLLIDEKKAEQLMSRCASLLDSL